MDVNRMGISAMERIRRLFLGTRADRRANVSSALSSAGRLQIGGLVAGPGPFDEPPNESIILAPDLPWELQEVDDPDREPKPRTQEHGS
jgi:hypothetical protein